jgi:hypothetical protein
LAPESTQILPVDTPARGKHLFLPGRDRRYAKIPVQSIGKAGLNTSLQGMVKVVGDLPIKVRYSKDAGQVVLVGESGKTVAFNRIRQL